jgi:hypothetical protein
VLHKSHDAPDPIASCWNIRHLLTGVKRELGTSQDSRLPFLNWSRDQKNL